MKIDEIREEFSTDIKAFKISIVLSILFVILKVFGYISWSWIWIFSPIWIYSTITTLVMHISLIFDIEDDE